MTKRLLIHAGNLKTGSTAIQVFLRNAADRIEAEADVCVPGIRRTTAIHAPLAVTSGQERGDKVPYGWSAVEDDVRKATQSNIILTSEVFIRSDPHELRDRAAQLGIEAIDVYFYLRPHIQMVTSNLAQEYKTGFFAMSLREGIETVIRAREICFVQSIRNFFDAFGRDRVHIREYARSFFPNGDVVQDFGNFLEIPELSRIAQGMSETERNPTPGIEELAIINWARRGFSNIGSIADFIPARDAVFLRLGRALAKLVPSEMKSKFQIPSDKQLYIKELFERERVEFGDSIAGFRSTSDWCNETVTDLVPPHSIPVEFVTTAFKRVIAQLGEDPYKYGATLEQLSRTVPTTLEKGVRVVPTQDLPIFAK